MTTDILRRVGFLTLAMAYSFDVDAASIEITEVRRELQGVTFEVSVSHQESIKTLRIQPRGLLKENKPIERNIKGTIGALPFCVERWSCRGLIQEGVSWQIG